MTSQTASVLTLLGVSLALLAGLSRVGPTPITPAIGGGWGSTQHLNLAIVPVALSAEALNNASIPFPVNAKPISWTDDYSDLLHVLR